MRREIDFKQETLNCEKKELDEAIASHKKAALTRDMVESDVSEDDSEVDDVSEESTD